MNINILKVEMDLAKTLAAKAELAYRLAEMIKETERISAHIELQVERENQLKAELETLKGV